jgi:hypothetical protein
MHRFFIAAAVLMTFAPPAQAQQRKNYEISVNGKSHDIGLNEKTEIKTKEGTKLTVILTRKEFAVFADKFVSFEHRGDMGVSSQDLGSGITQLMSATATGTLMMIQEYQTLDPTGLVSMLMNELTKEAVQYGHQKVEKPIEHTLASGVVLKGVQATLTYKGDESYWEVLAYATKDTGVIVATHIDKEFLNKEKSVLERFWRTLNVKF